MKKNINSETKNNECKDETKIENEVVIVYAVEDYNSQEVSF